MHAEIIADALRTQFGIELPLEEDKIEFDFGRDQYFHFEIVIQESPEGFATVCTRVIFSEKEGCPVDVSGNANYVSDLFLFQSVLHYGRLQVMKNDDGIIPYMQYTLEYPFETPTEPAVGLTPEETMDMHADSFGVWYLNVFSVLYNEARLASPTINSISKGERVHPEIGKLFADSNDETGNRQFVM
jgi:hypothetical protein